jgi:alginate O-acetyltransferase complex protein AlgI
VIFATKFFAYFLPVVLFWYFLLPTRGAKYTFLLLASWVFYAWCSPYYLWVLILLTLIDYGVAIQLEKTDDPRIRKRWLILSIIANLSLLAAFKYTGFAYDNLSLAGTLFGVAVPSRTWEILLPLGISFHTFQGISYSVDVYRRQIPAVRNFRDYALFVAFFPQMAAGPIVRAAEFLPQLRTPPVPTRDQIAAGVHLVAAGFFKKLIVADYLDQLIVAPVFGDPADYSAAAQRWACVAWAVQIYCDFSGYSDIATGIAKWFGFEFPANFNRPYLATSVTDFWRRWHLSFSTWLRDYLYFPLGGSRGSSIRTNLNLIILFLLCGLWHGATWAWLAYGLLFGLLGCAHRAWEKQFQSVAWRNTPAWTVLAWAGTAWQLLLGLILVRMPSWTEGLTMMKSLAFLPHGAVGSGEVPYSAIGLMLMGLAGHAGGRIKLILPEPVLAFRSAGLFASIMIFGPGVGQTFLYIQF